MQRRLKRVLGTACGHRWVRRIGNGCAPRNPLSHLGKGAHGSVTLIVRPEVVGIVGEGDQALRLVGELVAKLFREHDPLAIVVAPIDWTTCS